MAVLLASCRSFEGSLPPPDWNYLPESWHNEDGLQSAEYPKASGPSPLLHGAFFCGDIMFYHQGAAEYLLNCTIASSPPLTLLSENSNMTWTTTFRT
ncbi:hypothetical protein V8D89_008996 [Ganoderma adspersum]